MRNLLALGLMVFLGISLLIVKFPHKMLSPGELIEGHQKLNNNCFACHDAFQSINNPKCISCHELKKIDQKQQKTKGDTVKLLNVNFHTSVRQYNCTICHKDHAGIDYKKTASFEHKILKPEILENCTGCHKNRNDNLHKKVSNECSKCHSTESWKKIAKFDHKLVNNPAINTCATCHKAPKDDIHTNYLDDCKICHSTIKWSPAKFEHSRYFQLDPEHNVKCNICHKSKSYKSYTCYGCHEHSQGNIAEEHREEGISNFNDCVACHKDAKEDSATRYPRSYNKLKNSQSPKKNEDDDD